MDIRVEFTNVDETFTAGDSVTGNVIIQNDNSIEVTGLNITMLMKCKLKIMEEILDKTKEILTQNLNSQLFQGTKNRSKVFTAGTHSVPFRIQDFAKDYPVSAEGNKSFYRYFMKTELILKSKTVKTIETPFTVVPLPLDRNPAGMGWQTRSDSKFLNVSMKKFNVKVAVPTGIDQKETVPIHLLISTDSKKSGVIIRSRLVRITAFNVKRSNDFPYSFNHETIVNENVEEIEFPDYGWIHFLKVVSSYTYSCSWASEKYRLRVEVEKSKKVLKFEFPVIVAQWIGRPARKESPFGFVDPLQEKESVLASSITDTVPSAPLMSQISITSQVTPQVPSPPPYEKAIQAPPLSTKSSTLTRTEFFYTAKALYSFKAADPSELSFEIGQIITNVHESNESGWLVGTINGRTGLIPGRYVEPVQEDNQI